MPKKKHYWIDKAIKHKGSYDRYCEKQGMHGATAACIAKGARSRNATTRHRANLARTLESFNKPHQNKLRGKRGKK